MHCFVRRGIKALTTSHPNNIQKGGCTVREVAVSACITINISLKLELEMPLETYSSGLIHCIQQTNHIGKSWFSNHSYVFAIRS